MASSGLGFGLVTPSKLFKLILSQPHSWLEDGNLMTTSCQVTICRVAAAQVLVCVVAGVVAGTMDSLQQEQQQQQEGRGRSRSGNRGRGRGRGRSLVVRGSSSSSRSSSTIVNPKT